MSGERHVLSGAVFGLIAGLMLAQVAGDNAVKVAINHLDDQQPVANVRVVVSGVESRTGNSTASNGDGEVTLPIPPYDPAAPYIVVVTGWVIVAPCNENTPGRITLPKAGNRVSLEVLKVGDKRLLGKEEIGCLLVQYAAHFRPDQPPQIQVPKPPKIKGAVEYPSALPAYRLGFFQSINQGNSGSEIQPGEFSPEFSLDQKAKELHISKSNLEKAIDAWIKSATEPYDVALGAVYRGDFAKASLAISEAIQSPAWQSSGNPLHKLIVRARAEHEQGNQAAAEKDLQDVLKMDSENPIARSDLAIVRAKRKRVESAPSTFPGSILAPSDAGRKPALATTPTGRNPTPTPLNATPAGQPEAAGAERAHAAVEEKKTSAARKTETKEKATRAAKTKSMKTAAKKTMPRI